MREFIFADECLTGLSAPPDLFSAPINEELDIPGCKTIRAQACAV